MNAEYYSDETRKFSTYMRNYDNDHPIYKIASGSNGADYHWTKTVCKHAGHMIDAITFHNYTVTYEWNNKGKATGFTKDEYYRLLHNTLSMETMVNNHSNIIKQYERGDHKIGLIVDEWGTWFDVEDGTNPGFLYQQNTIRDVFYTNLQAKKISMRTCKKHVRFFLMTKELPIQSIKRGLKFVGSATASLRRPA